MLSVLVVIVLVDIDSLNVTATVVETATLVELSSGLIEAIVGAVMSEEVVEELSVEVDVLSVVADVLSASERLLLSSLAQLLRLNARMIIISTRKFNDFPCENIFSYLPISAEKLLINSKLSLNFYRMKLKSIIILV